MIAKILLTAGIVLTLSLIAEHVRPKVAGILSGFPLGFAIILYFYGIEHGADFAAASAVYTMAGFLAILSFAGTYYVVSSRIPGAAGIAGSTAAAAAVFFAVSMLIQELRLSLPSAAGIALAAMILFAMLFRRIENTTIAARAPFGVRLLALRALIAAVVVLVITAVAGNVGERWAGSFSAFPTTLLPLLLIIHANYGPSHAHTIIKNFPAGLGATFIYLPVVYWLYPVTGVHVGTAAAMLASALYSALMVYGGRPRNLIR